eukprot:3622920-Pyramimonas_sp.AAC.1
MALRRATWPKAPQQPRGRRHHGVIRSTDPRANSCRTSCVICRRQGTTRQAVRCLYSWPEAAAAL